MNSSNTFDSLSEEQVSEQAVTGEPSFGDILSQFEHEHEQEKREQTIHGTVVAVNEEAVIVDIGRKQEGTVPLAALKDAHGPIVLKAGDPIQVTITGRDEEGYYTLSPFKVKRPFDWSGLEKAFQEKATIAGTVAEVVKGGLRVDVGARAFLPASRSGARDMAEMEKLVGQEIQCRITKLDVAKEDVVVDRRVILEEHESQRKAQIFESLTEGKVVHGHVRTITDFGAFIDLGGVDGLLHVSDMSWNKVGKPADVVSVGDSVEVKILKIDRANRRISLGMKQLQPDPWSRALETLKQGDRVKGKVVRLAEFGAFVELLPGVDGLIHLSEMSWSKKVRKPADILKVGDEVEVLVLGVNTGEKRISLGLKQALGDPWENAEKRFPLGSIIEGKVLNLAKFGAFVDLGDGIEGMIHVGDITNEKRLDHPRDLLQVGQQVRASVLELDRERRRIRLGMKQLEPTAVDKWIAEHQVGETLSGRIVHVDHDTVKVEVGEGVVGFYRIPKEPKKEPEAPVVKPERPKADLGALTAMLANRWKEGAASTETAEAAPKFRSGQVRAFKINAMDAQKKRIDVEPT